MAGGGTTIPCYPKDIKVIESEAMFLWVNINKEKVRNNVSGFSFKPDHSLQVVNARPDLAGQYTCQMTRMVGDQARVLMNSDVRLIGRLLLTFTLSVGHWISILL